MGVLHEIGLDNPGDGVTDRAKLRDERQRTMLYLLQQVRDAIGNVDFHMAALLVNSGFIPPYVEGLPCLNQIEQSSILGLGANVKISGIEPPADIQCRNMLPWLVGCIRCGTLRIEIEMLVINRR